METERKLNALSQPEKEHLGRSTWYLLHTIAKHYPDNPTYKEKEAVHNLISALSILYPCGPCATGIDIFRRSKLLNPGGRESLSVSFCEFHNLVNSKLNKPTLNCYSILNRQRTNVLSENNLVDIIKSKVSSIICRIKDFYTVYA